MLILVLALFFIVELTLYFYGGFLTDPFARHKTQTDYVPSARPPSEFYYSAYNHPWQPNLLNRRIKRNNMGFRGRDVPAAKSSNEVRYFLVGDSFFADHMNSEENCINTVLQSELTKKFPNKEVVVNTTAYSGENNRDMIATMAHQLFHLKPNAIILCPETRGLIDRGPLLFVKNNYFRSDMTPFNLLLMLMGSLKTVQLLFWIKGRLSGNYVQREKVIHLHVDASRGIKYVRQNKKLSEDKIPPINAERLQSLLLMFKTLSDALGCKLGVVARATRRDLERKTDEEEDDFLQTTFPGAKNRYRQHVLAQADKEYTLFIEAECSKMKIPFLDMDPLVPKSKKYWIDDLHVAPIGSKIVGEELSKFIQQL